MLHTTENVIRHKIGRLNLTKELDNVSTACKIMGVSRDKFYRYEGAVKNGGVNQDAYYISGPVELSGTADVPGT